MYRKSIPKGGYGGTRKPASRNRQASSFGTWTGSRKAEARATQNSSIQQNSPSGTETNALAVTAALFPFFYS